MPWGPDDKGPWGSGRPKRNNQWGGGNRGGGGRGGQEPPDLDELFKKGQDKLRGIMGGGMGTPRALGLVALGLIVLYLMSGIYRVQPDEQGVVLRFGEWVRTTEPGLNYHLPYPIESVLTPKVTKNNEIVIGVDSNRRFRNARGGPSTNDESLMLTGDENIVDVEFTVVWRIKNAGQFLFNIRDPEQTVTVAAESAMREVIAQTAIQQILTEQRGTIEVLAKDLLQDLLDRYEAGIDVVRLQLGKVDPPSNQQFDVVDAFNDVQRARADLERLRNEAEAYRNDIIPRARGEAEKLLQQSQAYRESVINKAQGDAQRFEAILTEYRKARDVTRKRMYLETLEQIIGNSRKVFIDGDGQSGILPYLPLPELQRSQGSGGGSVGSSGFESGGR